MYLVGYLYEDYHDARSLEHKMQFMPYIFSRSSINELYYSLMMVAEIFSDTFNLDPEL